MANSYPDGKESPARLIPPAALAAAALAMAVVSPLALDYVRPAAERLLLAWWPAGSSRHPNELWQSGWPDDALAAAALGSAVIVLSLIAAWAVRRLLVMGKKTETGPTWDCGYAAPDNRMQYNATSFARPLGENFSSLVPIEDKVESDDGLFPRRGAFSSSPPGLDKAWGYSQLFRLVAKAAAKARLIQAGRVQIYLLYMAAVLVALLLWKL